MSKLTTTHNTQIGPNRVRHTIHFTRVEMRENFAEAARETSRNLPSRNLTVYEGEDCVILERNIV